MNDTCVKCSNQDIHCQVVSDEMSKSSFSISFHNVTLFYMYTCLCLGASTIDWPTYNKQCPSDLFECTNRECILSTLQCDGHTDCSDGSDEKECGMHA